MSELAGSPPGLSEVVGPKGHEDVLVPPPRKRLSRGALSWILHQGSRDPYVILVTIYVFAPYFSRVLVGDPVKGQAVVADISTVYGLLTALTAPLLGASIERYGPRKPFMAMVLAIMLPILLALWFATPGGLSVGLVGAALIVLGVAYNLGDVLNNSLLSRAAEPGQEPVLSGLGYALANGLSVSLLIFVMWAFVLPGQVSWSFVPATPLFGLSQADNEPSRLAGPLSAAVMLLGAIPFFLWTRDAARTGVSIGASLKEGVRLILDTFANLKGHAEVAKFLGARMFYCDGMTAMIIFGGLFAAGLMGWGALEMLAYGIALSVFGVLGGLIAPVLDRTLGPRRAVQAEIAGCILMLLGLIGTSREKILYLWPWPASAHPPVWGGPLFQTLPELVYLGCSLMIAVFVTAQYASSRTLLVRLAPPDRMAAFFGLFSLSGTATVWLGSLLVAFATKLAGAQVAGFIPIAALMLVGLIGLSTVKGGGREI
ncbi:MFS transporter [Caulobacter sp. BP25]|uniref:MFS transporter n=1 Tax=Caulobacter sp. BP25 TaxID=2048900 RepID=UPI000C12A4E0|nr:MFS transporter [Caulobacter sp. BP25]PHY18340.1 MFS transporter [Caulobacter sp. BP25]